MSIRTLTFLAAVGVAAAPAFADDVKKVAPDSLTTTEEIGKAVPTMKNDAKPAVESKAPDNQTYTGKVGEAVPTMTAPDGDKDGESKKAGKTTDAVAPDKMTTTEEIGNQVPKMKNDAKPAADPTAPPSQTYTDKVGESVPDMTAPEKKN